jgi:hypothetical protein
MGETGILVGKWVAEAGEGRPASSLLFGADGRMAYVRELPQRREVALLTYEYSQGSAVTTTQVSTGESASSEIAWIARDCIEINFQGLTTTYRRVAGPDIDESPTS